MDTATHQYPSLRARLAFVLISLSALFAAGLSALLYVNFSRELDENLRRRLENITTLAALQQDGDTLLQVQRANDEHFELINQQNLRIKKSDPDLIFVYTMRKDEQGIYFVVDAGLPGEPDISAFGERYLQPSGSLVENFDSLTGTLVEPDFYTDEYGTFLSGYAPIFSSDGERVGVLGIDISANTILARERQYLERLILIFLSAMPFLVVAGIVAANYLARPIVEIRDAARRISKGEIVFPLERIPPTRELAELAVDLKAMTTNLGELINGLEQRVADRTRELTRKADYLEAASSIAHQSVTIQDLATLLESVVRSVAGQFKFYHTGIFLINETGNDAILRASSSDGGRRMIESGYAVSVGTQGIVGHVAAQRQPRIALDVGIDAVFFNNPDLPMTRSEITLPLQVRDRLVGILDIQSDKPQAFGIEDIEVLETLANQIAVSIANAQLQDELLTMSSQLEALTSRRTREAWRQKLREKDRAFTYTPYGLRAERPSPAEVANAMTVPITLRGQQIGKLSIARKGNSRWRKADEDLIREVAGQVGLAIDNIRLLEDATERAKQEQMVGEIAFRFSQALDIDSLLQTAARELGQLPEVEAATVVIEPALSSNGANDRRASGQSGRAGRE